MNAPDSTRYAALAALALACAMTFVHAAPADATVTSLDTLRAAARQALLARAEAQGRRVDVSVPDLDPRLRLAGCTQPLETQIAGDGELHDYTSVAIRCSGTVRWTIYVRAAVSAEATVLIARGALARGAELTLTDFDSVRRTVPGTGAEYPADATALRGLRLRQPLAAGEVLTRAKLEAAAVVHRGQKVTLLARSGGIEIRVAAVALSDGRPSDRIQVQNENSHQVVEAVVRDAAVVEVPL